MSSLRCVTILGAFTQDDLDALPKHARSGKDPHTGEKLDDVRDRYDVWLFPFTRVCPNWVPTDTMDARGKPVLEPCGHKLSWYHGPQMVRIFNLEGDYGDAKQVIAGRMTGWCRSGKGRDGCGATVHNHGYFPNGDTKGDSDDIKDTCKGDVFILNTDCPLVFPTCVTAFRAPSLSKFMLRLLKQNGGVTFTSETELFNMESSDSGAHLPDMYLEYAWLLYSALRRQAEQFPEETTCVIAYPLREHLPILLGNLNSQIRSHGLPHRNHTCADSCCSDMHIKRLRGQGWTQDAIDVSITAQSATIVTDALGKTANVVCKTGSQKDDKILHPDFPPTATTPGVQYPGNQCPRSRAQGCEGYCKECFHPRQPAKRKEVGKDGGMSNRDERGLVLKMRRRAGDANHNRAAAYEDELHSMAKDANSTMRVGKLPRMYTGAQKDHSELDDAKLLDAMMSNKQPRTVDGSTEVAQGSTKEASDFGGKRFIVHVCRIAGIHVIMRPCGIILWWCVIFHHESLSQLYLLLHAFLSQADTKPLLSYIIFDYACGARQFFEDREGPNGEGIFGRHKMPFPKFVVDRFHFGKHDDEYCRLHCNPADHPEIDGVNSEACEQCFSWLGKYKFSVGNMTNIVFEFFMHSLIIERNHLLHAGFVV